MKRRIVEYSSYDSPHKEKETLLGWERLVEQRGEGGSLDLAHTLRSLKAEIVICKADNERLIEA